MVNTPLYLVCAIGGSALYLIFFSIYYSILKKPVGICYYEPGEFSEIKRNQHSFTSIVITVAMLSVYYYFRTTLTIPMDYKQYIFVAAASLLGTRGFYPNIQQYLLSSGIYEQGIVSDSGLTTFKQIKSYDIYESNKRSDANVVYLRYYTSNSKMLGGHALMIDREDKGKVQKIMKQRMTSNKLYK